MTHTPIMLEVAFEHGKSIVLGDGDRGIAIIPNDGGKREQERLDNANRIAALWNMAERLGLTTEEIEKGVIQDSFRALGEALVAEIVSDKIQRLEAEKATMLDALKSMDYLINNSTGVVGWHLNGDIEPWERTEVALEISDAIRKARG